MINTRNTDLLFEKYINYSISLSYKDVFEADKNETDKSKEAYKSLLFKLAENGYFDKLKEGDIDRSEEILKDTEENYIEYNEYYKNILENSNSSAYKIRNMRHMDILPIPTTVTNISNSEEVEFKNIFTEELDYYNISYYRYDFASETLYNKIALLFIIFSTILRLIKERQTTNITYTNIDEYYLNNFLVSHGFLYFNNINYDKKKKIVKYIMDYHNEKGSLNAIKSIVDLLNEKDVELFEYYLFYDNSDATYYFLKVKPDEDFRKVFNDLRSDRQMTYNEIVNTDPSWIVTEKELLEKNIKFIKTKYFSINSTSDLSDASRELGFLINKLKKYRDVYGKIYKFDLEGFSNGVELVDYLTFLTLLGMKINGYSIEEIKLIKMNEDLNRFAKIPNNWEYNSKDNPNKELNELIIESVNEIESHDEYVDELINLKKKKTNHETKTTQDRVREIKKELSNNYKHQYRYATTVSSTPTIYNIIVEKYPITEKYLLEEDLTLLTSQFMNFIDNLEKILMLYGQTSLKFKDIYNNLYLPKVIEIVNFFKSINAYLLNYDNSISLEKENKQDIFGDDEIVTGIIKISNRDRSLSGNSGNPDYIKEENFPNMDLIKDREVDLLKQLVNKVDSLHEEDFGVTEVQTSDGLTNHKDTIVKDFPIKPTNMIDLRFTSFSELTPFKSSMNEIEGLDNMLNQISLDKNKYYIDGYVIDFFGQEGTYRELREKYGLSYFEFRDKVKNFMAKYGNEFNVVGNKIGLDQKKLIFTKEEHIPFIKKPFLFRRVSNKVEKGDLLFQSFKNRDDFDGALSVFELNNDSGDYEYRPQYTDKYRSLVKTLPPESLDRRFEPHTGIRDYNNFIEQLKEQKANEEFERELIGEIPLPPQYNIIQ